MLIPVVHALVLRVLDTIILMVLAKSYRQSRRLSGKRKKQTKRPAYKDGAIVLVIKPRPKLPMILVRAVRRCICTWKIIDFKQSNKPKRKEWIRDYELQMAAYAMAHDYVYGTTINAAVNMVCTPDLYYQEFRIEGSDLKAAKHEFLERLDKFYAK